MVTDLQSTIMIRNHPILSAKPKQEELTDNNLPNSKSNKLNKLLTYLIQMDQVLLYYILQIYNLGTIDTKDLKVALRALGFEPPKD